MKTYKSEIYGLNGKSALVDLPDYSEDFKLVFVQPERSKREDSCNHEWKAVPTTEEAWCTKCGIEPHELKEMRYSEHCGNTVRKVQ